MLCTLVGGLRTEWRRAADPSPAVLLISCHLSVLGATFGYCLTFVFPAAFSLKLLRVCVALARLRGGVQRYDNGGLTGAACLCRTEW